MSDKSIAQKLLFKPNYKVLLVNAPNGYDLMLGYIPSGVTISVKPTGQFELIQAFITSRKELVDQLEKQKNC
jgi:hypothetical protein